MVLKDVSDLRFSRPLYSMSSMCRSTTECPGGRRCPRDEQAKRGERDRARRYYQRAKARALIAHLRSLGLQAMDDLDCPTTYHTGRTLDLTRPEPTQGKGIHKPPGLWSAPGGQDENGGIRTTWTDRSAREGSANDSDSLMWAITPQPGAVVLRIDSRADLEALETVAPGFHERDKTKGWDQLRALGISGALLTSRGHTTAYVRYYSGDEGPGYDAADALTAWDVGSAVWFNNKHITAEQVETSHYEEDREELDDDDDPYASPRYVVGPSGSYDEGQATTKAPKGAAVARRRAE